MSTRLPLRPIRGVPAVERFASEWSSWLDEGGADLSPLYDAATVLCRHIRANGLASEHLLAALQNSEDGPRLGCAIDLAAQRVRDSRYAAALSMLVETCYGYVPQLRLVRGVDHRDWIVMHIREGMRWDPEIEMRRQDWLCCVTSGDRRYITPVPTAWDQWSDVELLGAVLRAKPDLRGPD